VADELPGVLVVADEAVEAVHLLVQPDRVEVVAPQVPKTVDRVARIDREAADPVVPGGHGQLDAEVGAFQRLLEGLVGGGRVFPPYQAFCPSVSLIPFVSSRSK